MVSACSPSASPGVWTEINTAPTQLSSGSLCGGPEIGPLGIDKEGGIYAEDVLNSPTAIPTGAVAGWAFTPPAGAEITAVRYYRGLGAHTEPNVVAGLFLGTTGPALEQCAIGTEFGSPTTCSMPNNQAPVVFSNLHASSLFFGVACRIVSLPASCTGGGTIHSAQGVMYSARVTVSETSAPVVTNAGGALWGGGLVNGSVPVTFSASDASGIRDAAVQSDSGQTLLFKPRGCDFTAQPPCPQEPNGTLTVDTTRVSDGTHTFRLVVTDTAGNSQVVTSPPIVVDNNGPAAPVGLTAKAVGGNTILLSWANPASPPAPVTGAMAQLCQAMCATAVAVNPLGAAQIAALGSGLYSARVWLTDSAGRGGPHNAALTTVTLPGSSAPPPPPPPAGGTRTRVTAVLHGRRLRVRGTVATTGRVTVSWRSKIRGRSVGNGSRTVTVRNHRIAVTFVIPRRARTRSASVHIVVRRGHRVVGQELARRA